MAPRFAPAGLSEYVTQDFHQTFQGTPVLRARYGGFLRNVAIAMGNSRFEPFREPLRQLAASAIPLVAEHAAWALRKLG
jgi:epoxyqueuosine reductase